MSTFYPSWLTEAEQALATQSTPLTEQEVTDILAADAQPPQVTHYEEPSVPAITDEEVLASDDEFLCDGGCEFCEGNCTFTDAELDEIKRDLGVIAEAAATPAPRTAEITKQDLYAVEDVVWAFEDFLRLNATVGIVSPRNEEFREKLKEVHTLIDRVYNDLAS